MAAGVPFARWRGPRRSGQRKEEYMRRSLGLALASLALVLPATASAKAPKAAPADPYKVLIVTSVSDAATTSQINAITQAVGSAGTVTAPAPADVGAQFTPQ